MKSLLACLALAAAACHSSSPVAPATAVAIESPSGAPLTGIVHFYNPQTNLERDNCSLQSTSCTIQLTSGTYDLVLIQNSTFGPSSVTAPTGSCFMAQVKLIAGQPLRCKQNGRAGCRGFANLECSSGEAADKGSGAADAGEQKAP
jgi:hypothetical protein